MTYVRFRGPFGSTRLAGVGVPVQIRTPELQLVKTVMSSDGVTLNPGRYIVTARLPAGHEITRMIDAGDADQTIDLRLDTRAAQPLEAEETPTYISQQRRPNPVRRAAWPRKSAKRSMTRGFEDYVLSAEPVGAPAVPQGVLRCFTGNPLAGPLEEFPPPSNVLEKASDVVEYRIKNVNAVCFTQSVQPDLPPVNIALPISQQRGCILLVHRQPDRYWIEVHLENPEANLLLGYQQNREMQEEAVTAERLLQGKLDDPVAAMVGAYSLLRFGELDRLHNWSQHLMDWMRWIPDGAAIRGEHLARLGRHQEALEAFLAVPARGIPMFSDGISFLVDRLRLYTSSRTATQFHPDHVAAAKELHAKITDFSSYVDFEKILTTFTGLDPSKPDTRPFHGPLPPGTDCAAAFE